MPFLPRLAVFCLLSATSLAALASAEEEPVKAADATGPAAAEKYLLKYKFQQGTQLRWQVEHRALVRTTVSGTSQTAETLSDSVKVWQVSKVDDEGRATFVHSVQSVDMRQKLTGRQEVRYNSQVDKTPPPGFEDVAKSVGVPLSVITLDTQGNIVSRQEKRPQSSVNQGQITIPLPTKEVAVGEQWAFPYDVDVPLQGGGVKQVKTRQRFTLEGVKDDVATIRVETQILTPIHDPAVESQLIQRESNGLVQFDIDAGRVIAQQTDIDKRVVGFQGEASSMHYVMRFVEKLLPEAAQTARSPRPTAAGPALPPKRK